MPTALPPSSTHFEIRPLPAALRKETNIGAEMLLRGDQLFIDPDLITDDDRELLRTALYEHSVLVVRKQKGIEPSVLPRLARVWDDHAKSTHSGGAQMVKDKDNILSKNGGDRIPRAPQVSVLGSGHFKDYEGLPEVRLRHLNQREFHADPLTEDQVQSGQTRFYRWHLDAPLYERLPGRVTLIHGVKVPTGQTQRIELESGENLHVAPGASAFVSGAKAFSLLSSAEQEFALNTTIQYAPRAYEWIRDCKATSDGLTIARVGDERALDDLPEWSWDKVQSHPMVWKNPGSPDKPLLEILGCCVYALRTKDPQTGQVTEISDLARVREIVHGMQKKVLRRPEYIYAHAWEEGDLVVFHNKGVWHSITGNLDGVERILWQCTMESGVEPEPALEGSKV
ncbi:alpha-ketoglutarate dependent xanthine dioxygenase [Microdochium trichocladiopsis]|uniref:Alpha-ketoglutarate dependent xanthine dioxygenase n=1 Tax=Microdochium trichocladiopsis TaxID=1682393 RepID=A0A9P9BP57_9PEZI|nr:alpha-ketoglutarate dependent xanthine dioxygenase [Microdochium trichocladiopsis]KAH7028929.1 alpha-ketoglutarate dependent xanthine dioxygenase [Microdochium trichocladiopsis]